MPKKTPKKRGSKPERLVNPSKVEGSKVRVIDKRPIRAPRRPEAARFESGRRTGAKKRLGR